MTTLIIIAVFLGIGGAFFIEKALKGDVWCAIVAGVLYMLSGAFMLKALDMIWVALQ